MVSMKHFKISHFWILNYVDMNCIYYAFWKFLFCLINFELFYKNFINMRNKTFLHMKLFYFCVLLHQLKFIFKKLLFCWCLYWSANMKHSKNILSSKNDFILKENIFIFKSKIFICNNVSKWSKVLKILLDTIEINRSDEAGGFFTQILWRLTWP